MASSKIAKGVFNTISNERAKTIDTTVIISAKITLKYVALEML